MPSAGETTAESKPKDTSKDEQSKKPVFVFQVARHGSRVPAYIEDKKYHTSQLSWARKPLMLTALGEQQMSKLGRSTRESYIEKNGLLSNQFNPEEFSIRSANDERSVLSAYAYLLGLYPESIKNPKLISPSTGKDMEEPYTQEQLETLRTDLGLDKVPIYGPDPKIFVEKNDPVLFSSIQD